MVKNTVGGKKGKMLANKTGNMKKEQLRLIEVPEIEMLVCVSKVFGGGLFEVVDNDNHTYRAFLRGKMKGHNKRHNLVSLFSILLVAKRIDTDPTKCDILYVYDTHDIQFLALMPTLNISNILSLHNNHLLTNENNTVNNDDLFVFTTNANANNNDKHIDITTTKNDDVDGDAEIDFNLI
jgi:translation initiation factor IF-1